MKRGTLSSSGGAAGRAVVTLAGLLIIGFCAFLIYAARQERAAQGSRAATPAPTPVPPATPPAEPPASAAAIAARRPRPEGVPAPGKPLPNFDARERTAAKALDPARLAAVEKLRGSLPMLKADFDEITGAPRNVTAVGRFLAPGAGLDAPTAVERFIAGNGDLFGHSADALKQARQTRKDVAAHNGLTTLVWQQELDGIPLFDTVLRASVTRGGDLVTIGSHFIANPPAASKLTPEARAAKIAAPPVSAPRAIALAAAEIGTTLDERALTASAPAQGAERKQPYRAPLITDTTAQLTWVPMSPHSVRLAWEVTTMSLARGEMYRVVLDADDGSVLVRQSLTSYASDASYRVYADAATAKPFDSPNPMLPGTPTPSSAQAPEVPRQMVTLQSSNATASPNGWIDDGGTTTVGNNVQAHTDTNADNAPDLPRPTSATRVFDFAMDLTQAPSTYRDAAVTQLFYLNNWMHDRLYELGFTESSGNFQTNNFGRGGLGNDPVQADAQDGSGTNNANMSTPTDGSPPRMQMFVFTAPTPDRDGDFDAVIVLHEYTHGLSNRLVGGGVGISQLATAGMGEGWSDFYGLALLADPASDANAVYPGGAYATLQLNGMTSNYYYGIRRYPYSTDLAKNPLTLKDSDPTQASPHTGVPLSPRYTSSNANPAQVHAVGEIWCVALWECRAQLIAKMGLAGAEEILQLVTDGMKLSPVNPNFIEARDAILQADVVNNGGANLKELWTAFAKRGMGVAASTPPSNTTTGVVEDFGVPDDLSVSPVQTFTSTGSRLSGPFTPAAQVYTLGNIGTAALNWTASKTQPWLDLSASGGSLAVNATATVTATINAAALALPPGTYTDTVTFTNLSNSVVTPRPVLLVVSPYRTRALYFPLDGDPLWPRDGEWQFGTPTGVDLGVNSYPDPTSGATGANVLGINLQGAYGTTFMPETAYVTAGPFNLTGVTGAAVRFSRWLNSSAQPFVEVTVDVSTDGVRWSNLWNNSDTLILENAWSTFTYALGAQCDNQPTVYLRWGHRIGSTGTSARGGWNIDDLEILASSVTPTLSAQAVLVSTPNATPVAVTLGGVDSQNPGASLTYALVSNPARGTLTGTAPNLTYTPAAGFYGTDTFSYTVSNGTLTSAPASVAVTVQPGSPEITVELPDGTALVDGVSTVNFGATTPGIGVARRVVIRNVGSAPLRLNDVTVDVTLGVQASVTAAGVASLEPGASASVNVFLTPTSANTKTTRLRVLSNDTDEASFDITLTVTGTTFANGVSLLRDINRTAAGMVPTQITVVGPLAFFVGNTAAAGAELWRTDGTRDGTSVIDISPGVTSSGPSGLVSFNGALYFAASTSATGTELFRSDGTVAGTALVRDIANSIIGSSPTGLTVVGNTLFFAANDGINGMELWKSDGTNAGTVLVKDINAGITNSTPTNLRNVGGTLFFTASDGVNGLELWKSDGTAAGTVLVRDITAGTVSTTFGNFAALGSRLIFTATDATNGNELWVSDGTAAGTTLLGNLNPGTASSTPANLTAAGGTVYFTATTTAAGTELWKTDGTPGGTVLVKDIYAGAISSSPSSLTMLGSTLYFAAVDAVDGRELWKSDGTTTGTVLVRDLGPQNFSSSPSALVASGGWIYFYATADGVTDFELWRSDGTVVGTSRVKDINVGSGSSLVSNGGVDLNGLLIFSANDGLTGQEPWRSDGTSAGTFSLIDGLAGTNGSSPANLRAVNGVMYFSANDFNVGLELWRSDGTGAGTVVVRDVAPGANSSTPGNFTNVGNTLYFSAFDGTNGTELWKSDGTAVGTSMVANIAPTSTSSSPNLLTPVGSTVFFSANDQANGAELWRTDGTAAGTVLVRDINPTAATGSSLANLTEVNGTLFFSANDGTNGQELWKSDGTAAGTVLVRDINPGSVSSSPANFRVIGNSLFFTATTAANGTELWVSDGTSASTVMVADLFVGTSSGNPGNLVVIGSTLYFSATTAASGTELWKSDGTAAGTVLVRDILPGSTSSAPFALAKVGSLLFFRAGDATAGAELWKSDGTTAGTVLVSDIVPGGGGSSLNSITDVNGVAYFVATTAAAGTELWKSDGTAAGTVLVADLVAGPSSSSPTNLTAMGNLLFVIARSVDSGTNEVFVVPTSAPPEIAVEQPLLANLTDGASTVDLGTAGVNGTAVAKTFTVRNLGSAQPLVITDLTIDGPDAAAFFTSGISSSSIPAGGSATFSVSLNPLSLGAKTATLRIGSTDPDENPFDVALTSTVVASPEIEVELPGGFKRLSGDSVNVGNSAFGTPVTQTLTIRNTGTSVLNLGAITFDGSSEFTANVAPANVAAGATATLTITFTPTSAGARAAVLHLATNDLDENPFDLRTVGIGTVSPGLLRLARDVNATGSNPNITGGVVLNGVSYFVASSPANGTELWKSDGTAAGTVLVRDIFPGVSGSGPANVTVVGNTIYFTATDGVTGTELWKTDGTTAGTVLVRDIFPGASSSNLTGFCNVNGTLFFAATDSSANGAELWKSDGTTAGTVLVANINPTANASSSPANLTAVGSTLFFTANDGVNGVELWKSDGTTVGTVLVRDIVTGTGGSLPASLTAVGSMLFFSATDATSGAELWKSDGTSAGTTLVADIVSGSSGSFPAGLVNVAGTLFFRAANLTDGTELWKSDGTSAGTVMVRNISPGGSSLPQNLLAVDSIVYFAASDGSNGNELWKSDGTSAGTVLVADLFTGAGSSNPAALTRVGDLVYFTATSATSGTELWKTDGTAAGTTLVRDVNVFGNASPGVILNLGSALLFVADDGVNGREIWRTDGTAAGTSMVVDLVAGTNGSNPSNLRALGSSLLFSAVDGLIGTELWKSSGTTVALVDDIVPGVSSSLPGPGVVIGSRLYFSAFDTPAGTELWASDGTEAGTVRVKDIVAGTGSSSPANLTRVGSTLFFSATGPSPEGTELWKSDGTAAGTVLVKDIQAGAGSSTPGNLTEVAGTLFFTATDGTTGVELWKSDGTAAGTVQVKDINAGSAASTPSNLRAVGNTLYFTATTAANGTELWKSDGTDAGTVMVADVVSGSASSNPGNLTAVGSTLYFTATTGAAGTELWKTDGTTAGTVLVADIVAGLSSSTPSNLTPIGSTLYFAAANSANGRELWKSDGTAAGTVLVRDIVSGTGNSSPASLLNVLGTLYFVATTSAEGVELWKSDGTDAGTVLVSDLRPGTASSAPSNLTLAGNSLYFSATGSDTGTELWALDFEVADISIESPAGTPLVTGASAAFPDAIVGNGGATTRTFTVHNTAAFTPLTNLARVIDGTHASDFTATTLPAALNGGATSTLTITFAPLAPGPRTATLRVTSNDPDEPSFDITLTGTASAPTVTQAWRLANFGSIVGGGITADGADFDGDGLVNAMEFAFGLNPKQSRALGLTFNGTLAGGNLTARGLPITIYDPQPGGFNYHAVFVRRSDHASTGLSYTPEFSARLGTWESSAVTPTVLFDDGTYQAVSVPYPLSVGGEPPHFMRVRIILGP